MIQIRKKSRKYVVGILAGVLIIAVSIFGYVNFFSYKAASEVPYDCEKLCFTEGSTPRIDGVKVVHNFNGVRIKNESRQSWDCDIIAVSGFFASPTFISPGKSVDIAYNDFTDRNVRLDTEFVKPDNLSLQCTAGEINQASKFQLN